MNFRNLISIEIVSGEYGRKLFCLINIIMTDLLCGGIVQPVLVVLALIASPIVALLLVICKIISFDWQENLEDYLF